jgi:hypothetical protein
LLDRVQRHRFVDGGERDLAMLQAHRILAENLPSPASQRRHRRVVVGGDALHIGGARHQPLRDAVLGAFQLQQHFQQVGDRPRRPLGDEARRLRRLLQR